MHHRGAQIHQVPTYGYVGRPAQMGMHNQTVPGSYGVQPQQIQPHQMQNQPYQMHMHNMNQTAGMQRIGQQMIQRIVPNQKRGRSAHISYPVNTQNKRRSHEKMQNKRKSSSRNDSSKSSHSKGRSSSNSRKSYESSRKNQQSNRSKQAGGSRKSSQKASFGATQADNGQNNSTVGPTQTLNNSPAINPTHAHNNSATIPSQPHNTLPMQPNATQLQNNSPAPKPTQAHNNSTVMLMPIQPTGSPIQPGNSSPTMPIQPASSPIMKSTKLSPLPTQLSQQNKSPVSANNPSNQAHQTPTQPTPTKPMQPINNSPGIQTKSEKERADEQWGDIVMFLCELVEKKQLNEEELQTLVTLALDRDQKLLTLYLGLNKRPKQFIHCVRAQLLK